MRKIPSVQNSRNCRVEGNTNCTRTDGFPEFAELPFISNLYFLSLSFSFSLSFPPFPHLSSSSAICLLVSLSLLFPVNFFSFPQYNIFLFSVSFLISSLPCLQFGLVLFHVVFSPLYALGSSDFPISPSFLKLVYRNSIFLISYLIFHPQKMQCAIYISVAVHLFSHSPFLHSVVIVNSTLFFYFSLLNVWW